MRVALASSDEDVIAPLRLKTKFWLRHCRKNGRAPYAPFAYLWT